MSEFNNKIIKDVHASRYIASWMKVGGHLGHGPKGRFDFSDWLESLGLSTDEVNHIYNLATCGRLELETSARDFIESLED